jgi:hypothetical protein
VSPRKWSILAVDVDPLLRSQNRRCNCRRACYGRAIIAARRMTDPERFTLIEEDHVCRLSDDPPAANVLYEHSCSNEDDLMRGGLLFRHCSRFDVSAAEIAHRHELAGKERLPMHQRAGASICDSVGPSDGSAPSDTRHVRPGLGAHRRSPRFCPSGCGGGSSVKWSRSRR